MPPRQRRLRGTRDSATAQAVILDAAIREFAAKGLAGARVDAIARAARVAKGLVFHHYGSKQALWVAALEHIYATLRSGQDAAAIEALGPVEGIRELARSTFRLFRDHPEIVALMNEENLHRASNVRASPRIRALYNPLFAGMQRLLDAGRRAGLFRDDVDVTALYIALSGLGYFYCANRWTLSAVFAGDLFREDRIATYESLIADMVVAHLQHGVKPRRPRRSARGTRSIAL
ncbi:MAG: TetR family transcriptional regulator [Alphaproteobacteria bacterium]|nr:TetR family transcriptional regulator [Alphaproteobacteria bacterium]